MNDLLDISSFIKIVEIVPPKLSVIPPLFFDKIASLQSEADYFSVPSNPMGNIHMANGAVCREITRFSKKPSILHLPIKGRDLLQHQSHLLGIHQMGIRHLLIVMGDRTIASSDNLDTTDLVRLVKEQFNRGFNSFNESIGEPTKFVVGCAVNLTPSQKEGGHNEPRFQIDRLHLKIQAGADFLITQPLFDVEKAKSFLNDYEQLYGPISTPIFPAIAPFGALDQMQSFSKIAGITLPPFIVEQFSKNAHNFQFFIKLINQLKTIHPMVKGVYLIPSFSSFSLIKEIISLIHYNQ